MIAWVTLDVGVTALTNIVGCTEDQLAVGLPVTALFEAGEGNPPVLRFTPRAGS